MSQHADGDKDDEMIPLLDVRIAELAMADGVGTDGPSMADREDPWVYQVNDELTVAVNTDIPSTIKPEGCIKVEAEPFRIIMWYNGWVSYLGPEAESIMGSVETEDKAIALLEEEMDELGYEYSEEGDASFDGFT